MERTTTSPGHAPFRPEDLLEHSAWLRRLAGTLVRGDADAEDLVQETWLAALRSPPLADRPARGWLREVATNAGRMRARTDGRRARREAEGIAVGDPSTPPADVLLSRLAAQRRLSVLVAELSEPFRTTVILRYFEGLSAADIARRQRVPEGTVRWRLKTGLDRLRAELDRDSGGDRARWCLLLAPLGTTEGGPMSVLNGIVKGFVKGISKWVWGLSHGVKLLVAALVALLTLGGWLRFGPGHGASTPTVTAAAGKTAAATPGRRSSRALPSLPGPAALALPDAQVEQDEAAVHGAFEGRVINWSTGRGVAGAEVTFSIDGTASVTTADEDGAFSLEPPRSGRSVLAMVTAPGYLPYAPDLGHSRFELFARPGLRVRDLTVQLVPAIDYTGVVVDATGKPVAGATVMLLGAAQGEQALHPLADRFVTDERGEFPFHAPDNAMLEAKHPVHGAGRGTMSGPPLVSHRLTIKLGTDGLGHLGTERIAGRVVDGEGSPVAGATVSAWQEGGDMKSAHGNATTDASGRFTVEGLDAGRHSVAAKHDGYAVAMVDGIATGATDVLLDLRHGGTLSGRVLASDGAPLPAFTVSVSRRDGPVREISVASRAVVDAEGRFTIPDLAPGAYRVRATAVGHAPSSAIDTTLSGPTGGPVEIRLGRGGKLIGRLVEAVGGAPIEGARLSLDGQLDGSSAAPTVVNALTNAAGDFELTGIPAGVRSVNIGAGQHNMRIIAGLHFDEGVTTGPVTFDLTRTKDGEEPHLELAGLGATLHPEGDGVRIDKIYDGSGAVDAGLALGDTILAVDGKTVASLGFDDTVQRIRGPVGSTVQLQVRKGDGTVVDITVLRKRILT